MTFLSEYQFEANSDDAFDNFDNMNLTSQLLDALHSKGFDLPLPIQQRAIVPILGGRDVIVKAQRGTGRMSAFAIAALQKIDPEIHQCQVLVLTPDHTAALDILMLLQDLGETLKITSHGCLDDSEFEEERDQLVRTPPHIVVGTPGRSFEHVQSGTLSPASIKLLMLTDLDTMLLKQLGYTIENIFQSLTPSSSRSSPKLQVTLYFDFQTPELLRMADLLTRTDSDKIFVRKTPLTLDRVNHFYLNVEKEEWKLETLYDLTEVLSVRMVVFCNTREKQDWLTTTLQSPSAPSEMTVSFMHSDMTKAKRDAVMKEFRMGLTRILVVATPLVREDLNVAQISLLVGYDLPVDQEVYLRRGGSLGRYGRSGLYLTFVRTEDMPLMSAIERGLGTEILEMPLNIEDYV
ncbi:translation initiation factor eIF4A [Mortierella sp. AD031]|nr:translation initiation factor eIF4A [Mortierella sp. AD031]